MSLHSLRFKLIWIHGLAITLVVVCIGLTRYQLVHYRSQRRFDATLLSEGQFFASRLRFTPNGFTFSGDGSEDEEALMLHEQEHHFLVTDSRGIVLHEELHNRYIRSMIAQGSLDRILRQHDGFGNVTTADGTEYRFVSIPIPSGPIPQPAILHIGRSMDPVKGVLNEYLALYLYSVPLILVISAAAGWYLSGRALKPFEEITRTAEKITHDNLGAQIFSKHGEKEIQRLVQSFNAMIKRLDESFQKMRKFNADVAHELRTPLAILQGETEVALRSPDLAEETRSVLVSNLEELDRLARLVNDMLTLAEAEAGRQVLAKEAVDVKELLEDLVDQMKLLATDRSIRIELRAAPEMWINADKLWIRRAVINLLDNAIKYSKPGDSIEISAGIEDSAVRVKIRDYGIGISPADLPYIFDRLYRADPARNRDSGGAGLGLALVKWIVEAHQGTIKVTSQPDQGTCFEIALPAM